ncbi:MAG: hypothetical protein AB1757_03810 [Acidobacteriota bacterium]
MMKCPGFETLLDYLDGKLAAGESTQVAEHLAGGCAQCAANQNWYTQLTAIAASDESVEPPPWVTKRALRIFETRKPRLVERLSQAIAVLMFDSFARPAMAGVRSTETTNRQLLYNAGAYSIDLQVAAISGSHADLVGQVLREDEASFESVANLSLELIGEDRKMHQASTNEMGEFTISSIKQGLYHLNIQTSEGNITAADVPVIQAQ